MAGRFLIVLLACFVAASLAYDPEDKEIETLIPTEGTFEAFYPREMNGIPNTASRAAHSHGSFFKHRNPGIILLFFPMNLSTFFKFFLVALVDGKKHVFFF